jgi:hypothetical protein
MPQTSLRALLGWQLKLIFGVEFDVLLGGKGEMFSEQSNGGFFWVWSGIDKENGGMKRSFMMECVK